MYNKEFFITEPIGNNAFSYQERLSLGSQGKIYIPKLIHGNLDDLEIGKEIAFEEVENGKLISCKGLKNLIQTHYQGIKTFIIDNHDHALFFWYQHINQFGTNEPTKPFKVLHIDQHSDMKPYEGSLNVGNFITYALEKKIIDECIQIRTQAALHGLSKLNFIEYNYILDIDMDFRKNKSEKEIENDFEKIRILIPNISLITIATSPYFMDQNEAIKLIKKLLIP